MFFEKRLVYKMGHPESDPGAVKTDQSRRFEIGSAEFRPAPVSPDKQAEEKLDAEADSIVLQFLEFTFEENSDLFDTEKTKGVVLNDVITAITSQETKAAIRSKLQGGYAFGGYSKDKLQIIWQKDGVKSLQVNPVVLSADIRPLLKVDVARKLNVLLAKEKPLTLNQKVQKDFVKICKRLIDEGFINEDKVRGSEFEEDLKAVLSAMYLKAGQGKFDPTFDASKLIEFDEAGFTLKSADYFGKDVIVSFAIGEREYDEDLKRVAMEGKVADTEEADGGEDEESDSDGGVESGEEVENKVSGKASLNDMTQSLREAILNLPDLQKLSLEIADIPDFYQYEIPDYQEPVNSGEDELSGNSEHIEVENNLPEKDPGEHDGKWPEEKKDTDEGEDLENKDDFDEGIARLDELAGKIIAEGDCKDLDAGFHAKIKGMLLFAQDAVDDGAMTSVDQLQDWCMSYISKSGDTDMNDKFANIEKYTGKYPDSLPAKYMQAMKGVAQGLFVTKP